MQSWLMNASRGALSLIMGVSFGGFMAVTGLVLRGDSWPSALIGGAVGGVVFGAFMGPVVHRQYRRQREAVGILPATVERAAGRATWRGPVPEDPAVRAAAVRLLDHQLAELRRRRGMAVAASIVFITLTVFLATTESLWWWVAGVVFIGMLAVNLLWPRRLQRRADMLRNAD